MHRRDGKLIVSATDLVGFLECGHLTLLDRAAAAGLVHKPDHEDPEVELLQRRGGEHEQRYIEQLERDGRRVTKLTADWERPYEERAAETAQLMRRGDDVIYQATVFDGRWVGHPDFLLRVPPAAGADVAEAAAGLGSPVPSVSRLVRSTARDGVGIDITDSTVEGEVGGDPQVEGESTGELRGLGTDWHYEVADTKLAHSAKASALIQICSYVDQIERIQGVRPEKVYVVTGGAQIDVKEFRTADMMAYYRRAKQRFEEALDTARVGPAVYPIPRSTSYPDPVEHCAVCKWSYAECRPTWRKDDALPLVAGISRSQRQELAGLGVETRGALATATLPGRFERVREQARMQVASDGRAIPVHELLDPERDTADEIVPNRGLSALPPPSEHDLFFDIEGDPFAFWEGLEYLFGIWDGAEYRQFWAMNRTEEKQQFEQLMDLFHDHWQQHPDMHVYHYGVYEPSRLKQLAGRHATRQTKLDELLTGEVFVDLYRVVRQGVRVGTERYSIKNLEDLYGYRREVELRDANSSIVEFEKLLEMGDPDGALQEMIAGYNRDDCVSTERLRDWLEERRLEAARQFGVELPRPRKKEEETKPPTDWEVRLAEVIGRLPKPDSENVTEQGEATWLLASLLDWHRREDKATWWRFFELMTLSDDELFAEPEPIGRLRWEGVVGETKTGKKIHRYRFDAQEHRVGDRSVLFDPRLPPFAKDGPNGNLGTGTIDKDNLTLDIVRKPDWAGTHPTSVVPRDRIPIGGLQDALLGGGNWVAANGIASDDGEYRAVRDLLLRNAPRTSGARDAADASLVRGGDSGRDAALRLALELDGTTLAIQGPPGSGKTTTGTDMILRLVADVRRVGITGPSHKVVSNLLLKVCREAERTGVELKALQKVDGDDGTDHPLVKLVDDNPKFDRAMEDDSYRVIAGTVWLWARDSMAQSVHTLFVDECGQVALANVVAAGGAARNIVLLGDPQQLEQVLQGAHPPGAERSALGHFLGEAKVIEPAKGVFLEKTYRMHPEITAFTSELFYEDELCSDAGLEAQRVLGDGPFAGSGVRWVAVDHDGNTNASPEEAGEVARIVRALVGREWVNARGERAALGGRDIVIVSPFNAHRLLVGEELARLGLGVDTPRVGTVDKFQGQEAAVSIFTMATSRPEDAPRGLGFLFSLNRLNVATSRARALAVVVCSPRLLNAVAHSPDQLRMVNALCAFVDEAT